MSKGKKSKWGARTATGGKQEVGFRWWTDWTIVWILGSFSLVFLVSLPLVSHPQHWLFSVIGGVAGYPLGLFFDTGLPLRAARFARRRLMGTPLKPERGEQPKRRR